MVTVRHALSEAVRIFSSAGPASNLDEPVFEAEMLLSQVLSIDRWKLRIYPERRLTSQEYETFTDYVTRRFSGEPFAYIVGTREFWSRRFIVNPYTLIPRPETELIVEKALALVTEQALPASFSHEPLNILDVGTGSGILAITLALEIPGSSVIATDISLPALETTKKNLHLHGLAARDAASRISLINADWLSCFREQPMFDLVVSNPPYIGRDEVELMSHDVTRYEPHEALFSGQDGTDALRILIETVASVLKPGGWFLCEIGFRQGPAVLEIARSTGKFDRTAIKKDISGLERMLAARSLPE